MYRLTRSYKGIVIDAGHPSYLFPNVWYNK